MTVVAVAGVSHETNTFAPYPTDLAAFRERRLLRGVELIEAFTRTGTVVGGFLEGAAAHGWQVAPVWYAAATPAGTVTAAAFAALTDGLAAALADAGPVDGLLLELHGAMVVDGLADPERALVERVRGLLGRCPIVAVTDLHANMTGARLAALDALTGYRTNPHVDTHESGVRAAALLAAVLAGGLRPRLAHCRVPLLAAPVAQATDREPLAGLLAGARAAEARRGIADVTVHAGYAYADVPHVGLSLTVTAHEDPAPAVQAAVELAALAWERREAFRVDLPDAAAAFADAAGGDPPVAVTDTGDNVNGGAPGDGTRLLTEALARPTVRCLATVWDPPAVVRVAEAGVGGQVRVALGGRSGRPGGPPVTVDATVRWVGDGTFVNRGPMSTGATESMGRTAVLAAGELDVVVQERAVQPNDPELFRHVGLDPGGYDVILLKGAAAVRAGWAGLVTRFVDAGTPGVTDSDVSRLTFASARRPLWPLDDPAGFEPAVELAR